jgi:hypothetical protein
MRNRYFKMASFAAIAVLSGALGLRAKEKTMTPDEQKAMMMQQMQKYGTPGPNHQVLQQAEGRWTHTIRSWMKPGEKPEVSAGTSENRIVLEGRYLEQRAHGDWNGKPFEGLGYTGYDNVRGEFQSVWMDNMATGMMMGSGSYNAATKTVQQSGHFSCPITGDKAMWYRSDWKITDADNQTYSMYAKTPDGKEFKSMEIVYKRVK